MATEYKTAPITWVEDKKYGTTEGILAGCHRNTFYVTWEDYGFGRVYALLSNLPGSEDGRHSVDSLADGRRKAEELLQTFLNNILK